jgi:hypothetical protein
MGRKTKKKPIPIKDGDRRCIKTYFQAVNSNSGRKTNGKKERCRTYTPLGGQWSFDSGQQRYTSLMKTQISKFVPDIGDRPTTKTTDVGVLMLLKLLG